MLGSALDRESFASTTNVSRETMNLYAQWGQLLVRWNKKINLVSPNTTNNFWLRHALDSYQLTKLIPTDARTCIDLGSGAGFPGIAFAIDQREQDDASISLVESNGKKCNFMRTVVRELGITANIIQGRVESVPSQSYDVISARAFASLEKLFEYAEPLWGKNTLGLFPKGANWQSEIEVARRNWNFSVDSVKSETDIEARILLVKDIVRKQNAKGEI